jgi:hypothetical protein
MMIPQKEATQKLLACQIPWNTLEPPKLESPDKALQLDVARVHFHLQIKLLQVTEMSLLDSSQSEILEMPDFVLLCQGRFLKHVLLKFLADVQMAHAALEGIVALSMLVMSP